MTHARIQNGLVVEVIEDFMREQVPAPAPWPEGYTPTPAHQVAWDEQQAAHDNFVPGPVPMIERFHPGIYAQLVPVPEGMTVQQGDTYSDGVFGPAPPPAPPPPPTAAEVKTERDRRLAEAAIRIAPLQDAVDLGEATAEEEQLLIEWKQYRITVNRVTLQSGYPAAVVWPTRPTSPNWSAAAAASAA